MTLRFFTLNPDISALDALLLMLRKHVCNPRVVDDQDELNGLSALSRSLYQRDACGRDELVLAGDFHPRRDYLSEADVAHYLEDFGAAEMRCRDWRR